MRKSVEKRLDVLGHVSGAVTPATIDQLISAMHDPDPAVRSRAVEIAADHHIEAMAPTIEAMLKDKREEVRIEALKYFAEFPKIDAVTRDEITGLLRDRSFLVRIEALETISTLHEESALPGIVRLLDDRHPLVRAYAARAIAWLGAGAYLETLQKKLKIEKEDSARAALLESLFVLGREEAWAPFLEFLSSPDYRTRCAVANALQDMTLDHQHIALAISELTRAESAALGVADRSSIARALKELRAKETATR